MGGDFAALIPLISGAAVALVGWLVVHYLNLKRELTAEKRRLRVTYLLEAYRKLEGAGNRRGIAPNSAEARAIESAIADIQLLGTPKQVALAQETALELAKNGTVSFDSVLINLRQDLRDELELHPVKNEIKHLRIT